MKPESCDFRSLLALTLTALILSACTGQPGETTRPTTPATRTGPPTSLDPEGSEATPSDLEGSEAASSTEPTPTPPPGRIRPAAVAGSWYPDDADELARLIDQMLAAVEPVDGAPIGLIVPHAGYVYSGPVAAAAFRQMDGGDYDVAVIIASDHQSPLSDPISVWAEGGFETPLGVVPVDVELAQALVAADPRITFDPDAHEGEHPIEIELPFLQRVCPGCRIVPVLMGTDDEDAVQALTGALLSALPTQSRGEQGRPGRRTVLIASSDLSHYPAYDDALVIDGATLTAIETGDPTRVRETSAALMAAGFPNLATCACGRGPILVTMRVAQGLGADTINVLRYANSGDSPAGDRSQVVGYGAVMLWRYEPPDLTQAQREELLALVRETLAEYLDTGQVPEVPDDGTDDPILNRRSGAFVTLKQDGQLRGCIGHTRADLPLHQVVQQTAVSAATQDPRFPALTRENLPGVTVEISVLSPFRRVTDAEQVQVGTHGLMIFKDGRQGLLLPQVPAEQGWDRATFFEELCQKAGLPPGCWQENASIYAFTALVFGER